jgi:lysylphosphatidylglycerol synthetase-like protein (DUF2156 family)
VRKSFELSANLALLGEKHLLLNPQGNAFIMYALRYRAGIPLFPFRPQSFDIRLYTADLKRG